MIYVYKHIRKDTNQIFYIGIGDKSRPYKKSKRTKHWKNIAKLTDIEVQIICTFDDVKEARNCERYLIRYYGRRDLGLGPLVNFTEGGEGTFGRICSEDTKRKISEANKGRLVGRPAPWVTERMTGDKNVAKTASARKKISENNRMKDPEVAKKVADSLRGRKRPEYSGKNCNFYGLKGSNHPASKSHSRPVINTKTGAELRNQNELAKMYKVSDGTISMWINNKPNRPDNFHWVRK